jgi:hypothetical protein
MNTPTVVKTTSATRIRNKRTIICTVSLQKNGRLRGRKEGWVGQSFSLSALS